MKELALYVYPGMRGYHLVTTRLRSKVQDEEVPRGMYVWHVMMI